MTKWIPSEIFKFLPFEWNIVNTWIYHQIFDLANIWQTIGPIRMMYAKSSLEIKTTKHSNLRLEKWFIYAILWNWTVNIFVIIEVDGNYFLATDVKLPWWKCQGKIVNESCVFVRMYIVCWKRVRKGNSQEKWWRKNFGALDESFVTS